MDTLANKTDRELILLAFEEIYKALEKLHTRVAKLEKEQK